MPVEGIPVYDGDLVVRVHFFLGTGTLTLKEAGALSAELNAQINLSSATFEFKNTGAENGILVLRGIRSRFNSRIIYEAARGEFVPQPQDINNSQSCAAASLLNEFIRKSQDVLKSSNVNKDRIAQGKLPVRTIMCSVSRE